MLAPNSKLGNELATPISLPFLENVALRDLALHAHHGACVDARGDVYQWGAGFFREEYNGKKGPVRTLQGKVRSAAHDVVLVEIRRAVLGYQEGPSDRLARICAIFLREGIRHICKGQQLTK